MTRDASFNKVVRRHADMIAPPEVPQEVLERVRALCLALPEVTVRTDASRVATRSTAWSFDVRRRSFCLLVATRAGDGELVVRLVVRVHPSDRQALAAIGHPYFTPRAGHRHRDRLGVRLTEATDWDEIRELVIESYRLLAPKKLVALLG